MFLFGFNDWKRDFMQDWFPNKQVIFLPMKVSPAEFHIDWKWRILADPRAEIVCWQYKFAVRLPGLPEWAAKHGVRLTYVEDGFLRSLGLGAKRTPPLSMAFDTTSMYFDATRESDLELLLNVVEIRDEEYLRANYAMQSLIEARLSKYNTGTNKSPYRKKKEGVKRVLVIGQVERDASIQYGCLERPMLNNDLVWMARRENPDAEIWYKPHPEVMHGTAPPMSDPYYVSAAAQIFTADVSVADALEGVDHVYTITSLMGFEALIRGIKVTCFGSPWYSGWGCTDDRQFMPRRTRKHTPTSLFWCGYMVYPTYRDPVTKRAITFDQALHILKIAQKHQPAPRIEA